MPNRIIKESICTSEEIAECDWFTEVLFYRLIVHCDDFGRYDGRTKVIRGTLFPLDDLTDKQIDKGLARLSEVGLLRRYMVEDKPYIEILTWQKHQRIRNKKSKYPAYDSNSLTFDRNTLSNDRPIQSNPIQSESNPKENTKEKPIAKMIDEYTDDPVLKSALQDFVAMRRSMKGFTPRAMTMCLNELKKLSGGDRSTSIKIVNQSVKNGWKGFYALKKEQVIPEYKSAEITEEEATAEQIEAINKLKESLNVQS